MAVLKVLIYICLAYVAWASLTLVQNYRAAQKIGYPIVVTPIDVTKPWWYLQRHVISSIALKLPFGLGGWAHRMHANWSHKDRWAMHAKYGPAFIEVSPVRIKIFLADDEGVEDMLRRNNEFVKNPEFYGPLEVFGPNVDTVNGATWSRHRKITVPAFNEKNSALVWHEAISQATVMGSSWHQRPSVSTMQDDFQALALNVLCYAGLGIRSEFVADRKAIHSDEKHETARLGFREALHTILNSLLNLMVLPAIEKLCIPHSWLGPSLKRLLYVREQFKEYMAEMVANERAQHEAGHTDRHNLVAALIRADIAAKKAAITPDPTGIKSDSPNTSRKGLSESEIFGNLFVYIFAGHDTTASTMAFAIVHLALDPPLQEWIAKEIDTARRSLSPSSSSTPPTLTTLQASYTTLFPLLPRLLALMHETLRHHGATQMNPRQTLSTAPTTLLRIAGHTHHLPPDTMLVANFAAIHANPATWGAADVDEFDPRRFLTSADPAPGTGPETHSATTEKLKDFSSPSARGFVAWNRGPRTCPGRKFSQVEFVAAMFVLFAEGRRVALVVDDDGDEVKAGSGGGDGVQDSEELKTRERKRKWEEAAERARRVMWEAEIEFALKMVEDVPVRWFVRGNGGS